MIDRILGMSYQARPIGPNIFYKYTTVRLLAERQGLYAMSYVFSFQSPESLIFSVG